MINLELYIFIPPRARGERSTQRGAGAVSGGNGAQGSEQTTASVMARCAHEPGPSRHRLRCIKIWQSVPSGFPSTKRRRSSVLVQADFQWGMLPCAATCGGGTQGISIH